MRVELWICCFLMLHFQVEHSKRQRDHTALGRRTCRKSIEWMWWQCMVVVYNLNLAPTQCRNWMPWNSIVLWRPSCKTTLGRFDCESCLCIRVFLITERRSNSLRKQVYGCIKLMNLQNSVDVWKSKRHGKEFLKLGMIPFFTHESQAAANSTTALDLFLSPNSMWTRVIQMQWWNMQTCKTGRERHPLLGSHCKHHWGCIHMSTKHVSSPWIHTFRPWWSHGSRTFNRPSWHHFWPVSESYSFKAGIFP